MPPLIAIARNMWHAKEAVLEASRRYRSGGVGWHFHHLALKDMTGLALPASGMVLEPVGIALERKD